MKINCILSTIIFLFHGCSDVYQPSGFPHGIGKIYGFVNDKITGQAVPDVQIIVSQSGDFTNTDSSGYFEIDSLEDGYYSLYAYRENYYQDSVYVHLTANTEIPANLLISFKGLYAITDSIQYHLIYPQNNITVKILNNSEFTHYLWWWCDIKYVTFILTDTNWEIFEPGPPCIHLYGNELIELASKDSIFTSLSVNAEGTFYIRYPYRIIENESNRYLYSNVFKVKKE